MMFFRNIRSRWFGYPALSVIVLVLLLVLHSPPQHLQRFGADVPVVHVLRTVLWFFGIALLLVMLLPDLLASLRSDPPVETRAMLRTVSIAFAGTALLVLPSQLGIMGFGYAALSRAPFTSFDPSGQIYQRLLMPSLSWLIGMRGDFAYHVLSLVVAAMLLVAVYWSLHRRGITLTPVELISVATSSFLITQFQSPGYTEPLSYLFLIIVITEVVQGPAAIAAVMLGVLAHEGTFLPAIAFFLFRKKRVELRYTVMFAALYAALLVMSYGGDLNEIAAVRSVGNISALSWVLQHPLRELAGLFISFKLLWFVIGAAAVRSREVRSGVLLFLLSGILLTIIAVDTSRMAGFAFGALLLSIPVVAAGEQGRTTFRNICWWNFAVPAVYISVNAGVVWFDGLYRLLAEGNFLR